MLWRSLCNVFDNFEEYTVIDRIRTSSIISVEYTVKQCIFLFRCCAVVVVLLVFMWTVALFVVGGQRFALSSYVISAAPFRVSGMPSEFWSPSGFGVKVQHYIISGAPLQVAAPPLPLDLADKLADSWPSPSSSSVSDSVCVIPSS